MHKADSTLTSHKKALFTHWKSFSCMSSEFLVFVLILPCSNTKNGFLPFLAKTGFKVSTHTEYYEFGAIYLIEITFPKRKLIIHYFAQSSKVEDLLTMLAGFRTELELVPVYQRTSNSMDRTLTLRWKASCRRAGWGWWWFKVKKQLMGSVAFFYSYQSDGIISTYEMNIKVIHKLIKSAIIHVCITSSQQHARIQSKYQFIGN